MTRPLIFRAAATISVLGLAAALAACSQEPAATGTSASTGSASSSGSGSSASASASTPAPAVQLDVAAYDAIIAKGPVADDAVVQASEWARAVKESGKLRIGGTQTSALFSLADPATGEVRGFDAGLSQLLARYILGEDGATELSQVTSQTREDVLVNGTVDAVFATYSITAERQEKVSFAGPYYTSQTGILVNTDNNDITSVADLAGKRVAVQQGSRTPALVTEEAPDAVQVELPDNAQALQALSDGRVDAYVVDTALLQNAVLTDTTKKIVGEGFGPVDPYGIGLPKDSDGVAFVNDFLRSVETEGLWEELWTTTIGERTDQSTAPTPPPFA